MESGKMCGHLQNCSTVQCMLTEGGIISECLRVLNLKGEEKDSQIYCHLSNTLTHYRCLGLSINHKISTLMEIY
jgi:hypothetical protein